SRRVSVCNCSSRTAPLAGVLETNGSSCHTACAWDSGMSPRIRGTQAKPMASGTTAYLVVRRDDGFGDVFPLTPGQSYTLGRAATNSIVLKDDLCSREHAEVSFTGGRWRVRDLNSLNGTRVNDQRLEGDRELKPNDDLHVGRTHFL